MLGGYGKVKRVFVKNVLHSFRIVRAFTKSLIIKFTIAKLMTPVWRQAVIR